MLGLIVGGLSMAQSPEAPKTFDKGASPISVKVPDKFTSDVQKLNQQYADLQAAQQIADLSKANLELRVCAEVGYKPEVCRVDWRTGQVIRVEMPKAPATATDTTDTSKK